MTNLTPEQFRNRMWIRPAPEHEKKQKAATREFWGLCVPIGLGAAIIIALLCGSVEVVLPAWAVMSIVIWGAKSALEGESN